VPPGEYEIVQWVKTPSKGNRVFRTTPLPLPAGATAATVQVPALHTLVVELGAARAGRTLQVRSVPGVKGQQPDQIGADRAGRVTVPRLLAGEYALNLEGEKDVKTVKVPDTTTLTW
jgi:hypothetical protein